MWKCPGCSETVDDHFEVCWNCEGARDGSSIVSKGDQPPAVALQELPQTDGSLGVEILWPATVLRRVRKRNFSRT